MKIINHVLTEDEKKIIENHFIYNGMSSKKDYQKFCMETISNYIGMPFELKSKEPIRIKDLGYSINLIWDEQKNQTAIMHCFGHPKFELSNTKFKCFKTFNSDLNFVDIDGKSALIYLAHNPKHSYIYGGLINNPQEFDLYIKDKNNKTFHMYFFESYDKTIFDINSNKNNTYGHDRFYPQIGKIDHFQAVFKDWVKSDIEKTKEQWIFVAEKAILVAEAIKNFAINKEVSKQYRQEVLIESANNIEKIAHALHLNATMGVNTQTKTKLKI